VLGCTLGSPSEATPGPLYPEALLTAAFALRQGSTTLEVAAARSPRTRTPWRRRRRHRRRRRRHRRHRRRRRRRRQRSSSISGISRHRRRSHPRPRPRPCRRRRHCCRVPGLVCEYGTRLLSGARLPFLIAQLLLYEVRVRYALPPLDLLHLLHLLCLPRLRPRRRHRRPGITRHGGRFIIPSARCFALALL
jgi:hypothetical protein